MLNGSCDTQHVVSLANLCPVTSLDPDDPALDPPPEVTRKLVADVSRGRINRDDAEHIRSVIRRVSALTGSKVGGLSGVSGGAGDVGAAGAMLGSAELELVTQSLDPIARPSAYRYFREEFVFVQAVRTGLQQKGSSADRGEMCADVTNVLFLTPLKAGTGNYTLAGRIKKHMENGNVNLLTKGTNSFTCTSEFRDFLSENHIHFILGLHCYHAGRWLQHVDPQRIPYAVIFGGTDLNEYNRNPVDMKIMTEVVKQASELVVFCDPMLKRAMKLWPRLPPKKIVQIPQSIYTTPASRDVLGQLRTKYKIEDDCHIFTLVAGIRAVKDPLFLVQTFSEWHQWHNSSVHLVIVGQIIDPEYADSFLSVVDGCPGVLYLGGMSSYETHAIVRDSFALVNTSVSEGMCTAILEAMDLGVPVIARAIPGNKALITDKENGLLFSDKMVPIVFQSFVDAANSLIENGSFRNRIITAAKTYVKENHDCKTEQASYVALFERLNNLRPSESDVAKLTEEEEMFDLSASTASVNLAAVAAANSVPESANGESKKSSLKQKGTKLSLKHKSSDAKESSKESAKHELKPKSSESSAKESAKHELKPKSSESSAKDGAKHELKPKSSESSAKDGAKHELNPKPKSSESSTNGAKHELVGNGETSSESSIHSDSSSSRSETKSSVGSKDTKKKVSPVAVRKGGKKKQSKG